jgi:hypothetical protein
MTNVTKNGKKGPIPKCLLIKTRACRWLKAEVAHQNLTGDLCRGARRPTPTSMEANRYDGYSTTACIE